MFVQQNFEEDHSPKGAGAMVTLLYDAGVDLRASEALGVLCGSYDWKDHTGKVWRVTPSMSANEAES